MGSRKLEAMTPPVRLVAIDIDGTLLPSAGAEISARNRRALLGAEAAGVEVAIATGRRQAYAVPLIHPVGLRPETVMITSNGTVTRTLAGERMERFTLPVETARELCPVLRQFGGTTVFTFDREGPGELVLESLAELTARVSLWVAANREWIQEIRPLERAFDGGDAPIQGMVCGTVAEMQRAELWLSASQISRKIEMHRTEYPGRDLTILDILPPGCSKGAALDRLARRRGIHRRSVMAIGDNFNDLEMLRAAGQPVVMANGAPDLVRMAEQMGWKIAPSNDEDGVAQILESVLESMGVQSGDRSRA
jgi:Cof subfamily protein (haloacid dehalogenase superfamily)